MIPFNSCIKSRMETILATIPIEQLLKKKLLIYSVSCEPRSSPDLENATAVYERSTR